MQMQSNENGNGAKSNVPALNDEDNAKTTQQKRARKSQESFVSMAPSNNLNPNRSILSLNSRASLNNRAYNPMTTTTTTTKIVDEQSSSLRLANPAKPEIGKAKLRSKTPLKYSLEKNLRDIKTPSYLKSNANNAINRWSPIRLTSKRNFKLFEKIKLENFERERELEELFDKLDLDEDGHLEFETLDSYFLRSLNHQQKSFFFQVN